MKFALLLYSTGYRTLHRFGVERSYDGPQLAAAKLFTSSTDYSGVYNLANGYRIKYIQPLLAFLLPEYELPDNRTLHEDTIKIYQIPMEWTTFEPNPARGLIVHSIKPDEKATDESNWISLVFRRTKAFDELHHILIRVTSSALNLLGLEEGKEIQISKHSTKLFKNVLEKWHCLDFDREERFIRGEKKLYPVGRSVRSYMMFLPKEDEEFSLMKDEETIRVFQSCTDYEGYYWKNLEYEDEDEDEDEDEFDVEYEEDYDYYEDCYYDISFIEPLLQELLPEVELTDDDSVSIIELPIDLSTEPVPEFEHPLFHGLKVDRIDISEFGEYVKLARLAKRVYQVHVAFGSFPNALAERLGLEENKPLPDTPETRKLLHSVRYKWELRGRGVD